MFSCAIKWQNTLSISITATNFYCLLLLQLPTTIEVTPARTAIIIIKIIIKNKKKKKNNDSDNNNKEGTTSLKSNQYFTHSGHQFTNFSPPSFFLPIQSTNTEMVKSIMVSW